MTSEEKSANQFISALVKNLQAVCHGNVEFDKNVKVVGHLFLTVDSSTEFNYIVNEKVSKSDESSTTFISKSFYATDPQQKTPKKNLDRPLPPPTPNVLGKTRYDISVDLTDEPGGGRPMMQQRGQFSRPQGYPGSLNRNPQMRRRPFDQNRLPPHQMAKMPRFSSPQRQAMHLPSSSPRKIPPSQRLSVPSTITSSSPSSINDSELSVSATPAHSLPGADKPEETSIDSQDKSEKPDIKFEVIKVENGNAVASNKDTTEGDDGQLRIESVTSHDLSIDATATAATTGEKDTNETISLSANALDNANAPNTSSNTNEISLGKENDDEENEDDVTAIEAPPQEEPEVIEIDIDLTKVKDEDENNLNSSSCDFNPSTSGFQVQSYSGQGENSLSSFGLESNDDDFFNSLQEQTQGLYPVSFHGNEAGTSNFPDIPSIVSSSNQGAAYIPGSGTSSSQSPNNSQGKAKSCPICGKEFLYPSHVERHMKGKHLQYRAQCPVCPKNFTQNDNLKEHIRHYHSDIKDFLDNKYSVRHTSNLH